MAKALLGLLVTLTLLVPIVTAVPASASDQHASKTATDVPDTYYVGDTIHYEMLVENLGDTYTNNVTDVYDTLPGGSVHWFVQGGVDEPLIQDPGESITYNLSYVVDEGDLVVIPAGPNAGRWGVLNYFDAHGFDSYGDPVDSHTGWNSLVLRPAINITKTVDFDGDGIYGELETNYAGQNASWNITVCNSGYDPVYAINVTDTNGQSFGPFNLLAPGACQIFTYNMTIDADTVNNATAQGDDELGNPVGPVSDDAAVSVIGPTISIAKTVDFDGDDIYGELETNYAGQNASWNITVCNTGDDPVYAINVTDTNGQSFGPFNLLTPGACQTFTYNMTMNANTVNNATAEGKDELGGTVGPVSDTAAVQIFTPIPAIDIEKHTNGEDADDPPGPYISVNSSVNWTYFVTNTGAVNLTGIVVTDDMPGVTPVYVGGDDGDGKLNPSETWIYQAIGVAVAGQYANVGTVVGHYDAVEVTHSDPSHYYNRPTTVGWETYPADKLRALLPWIGLLGAIIIGGSLLVLRNRRTQS